MESLAREKEYQSSRTNDERLYRTCERSEQVLQKVNDIAVKDDVIKENMRNLDNRVDLIEERQAGSSSFSNHVHVNLDRNARIVTQFKQYVQHYI